MLGELTLILYVLVRSSLALLRQRTARSPIGRRIAGDSGEGVISTAIAVLIVSFLGAAMYVVFQNILESSGSKANDQVNQIGDTGEAN